MSKTVKVIILSDDEQCSGPVASIILEALFQTCSPNSKFKITGKDGGIEYPCPYFSNSDAHKAWLEKSSDLQLEIFHT